MILEINRYNKRERERERERERAKAPVLTCLLSRSFFFSPLSVESQISEFKYNFDFRGNNDCKY